MNKTVLLSGKRMRWLWGTLALTIVATFLLVACGGTPATAVQPIPTQQAKLSPTPSLTPVAVINVKILLKDGQYVFDPATLKIKVGTQVIWTN
ncbi:MAG: cupredoxin domain-containing protein, partial [Ktedonobacteraceae bacterium]